MHWKCDNESASDSLSLTSENVNRAKTWPLPRFEFSTSHICPISHSLSPSSDGSRNFPRVPQGEGSDPHWASLWNSPRFVKRNSNPEQLHSVGEDLFLQLSETTPPGAHGGVIAPRENLNHVLHVTMLKLSQSVSGCCFGLMKPNLFTFVKSLRRQKRKCVAS